MLAVFLSEDGRIIFTYPDVMSLCQGDAVRFRERDYVIVGRCFDVDAAAMELTLQEVTPDAE